MSESGLSVRLAVNGRFLTRPLTGVDRVGLEMVRALAARGAPTTDAGARSIEVIAPIAGTIEAGLPDGVSLVRRGRLRGAAWEQFDLARGLNGRWLYSPCNVGPLAHHNQILTIHDAQFQLTPQAYSKAFRIWYGLLLPRLARRARIVTTVSDYARRTLEQAGVVPPGKAVVIPNGADHILRVRPDPGVLERHGLVAGRYFLAIGSLSPHKNLKMVIAAAARRHDRSIPLIIAGGGNARVFANADLHEAEDVRFIGRVSDEELRALYDHATVLVFPSLYEGFGLPPLEAMNCGCPVIASRIPTIEEMCGDAVLYADPKEPAAWTEHMSHILSDERAREALSDSGRRKAADYKWARAADALMELVERVEGTGH